MSLGALHHWQVPDAGQRFNGCLRQQTSHRLQAGCIERPAALAPQHWHRAMLQLAQVLLKQVAFLELRVPQAGVGCGIAQCALLRSVQDG